MPWFFRFKWLKILPYSLLFHLTYFLLQYYFFMYHKHFIYLIYMIIYAVLLMIYSIRTYNSNSFLDHTWYIHSWPVWYLYIDCEPVKKWFTYSRARIVITAWGVLWFWKLFRVNWKPAYIRWNYDEWIRRS